MKALSEYQTHHLVSKSHTPTMADQQQQKKIHPVDVEAPPLPSAPLVPRDMSRSDKGDPAANERYPPYQRTMPVVYSPPPKKRRGCCCRCICWTLLILILLVVAVAATVGILYLVFDPKVPKYSVDKLLVTDFTVDAGLNASASFDVTVTANNPNKHIGIYYEDGSELSVWYSDTSLCSGNFPVFYQGHRNVTVTTVNLSGQTQLGSGLITELRQQEQTGMVPLKFRGNVPVRVKFGGLKLWKVTSKVRCDLVVNSLSANNQISIKTSSCKFSLKL